MNDNNPTSADSSETKSEPSATAPAELPPEHRKDKPRLDPVRYGDWEKNGRCIDF